MDVNKLKNTDATHGGNAIRLNDLCAAYAFLLTVAACLVGSIANTTVMLIIVALYAFLILRPEHLLGPVLFFTVFDDYLLAGSGASVSRFVTLFFIAGTALYILQKGAIKQSSLYLIVLIAFGVLLSFYSTYGQTSFPVSYVLNLILAITMLNLPKVSVEDIPKQIYRYAALAVAFVYLLFIKNGFDSLVEGSRMTIGEDVNSNQLAKGLAIVMSLLVCDLLLSKKHLLLNIVLIVANLVAVFLSGSRTALIAAIISVFFLCILNTQDKRSRGKAFLWLTLSVALLIIIYNTLQKAFPVLMERFTTDSIEESGGTGRIDIWKNYFIHFFPKYWFIGMGFNHQNLFYGLKGLNIQAHGAHNLLIEILSISGVVGLALYTICFVRFFRTALKNLQANRTQLLPIAIVITTLVNGIGENALLERFMWFGIGLGYMLLSASARKSENLPEDISNT